MFILGTVSERNINDFVKMIETRPSRHLLRSGQIVSAGSKGIGKTILVINFFSSRPTQVLYPMLYFSPQVTFPKSAMKM